MISIKPDRKNRETKFLIDNAISKVRKGLREELSIIGRENVRYAKKLIKSPPKSGRIYIINGVPHRASAPGEAPANVTGNLLSSIRYRTYGWERMEFGNTVPYGKFLEEGTKNMQPREHIKRTVRVKERDNYKSLEGVVKRAMKK